MLRTKCDIYIATPTPSLEAQGSSLKRWKKGYKRQTERMNAKHQHPLDIAGQLQGQSHSNVNTHKPCTSSRQIKLQHEEGNVATKLYL